MDREDKRSVKIGILIALFTVLLYLGLQNLNVIADTVQTVLKLLRPFIIGICFAFVLNILMRFFEIKVFKSLNKKNSPRWVKIRRPLCVLLTVITFLGLVVTLTAFIIPQLTKSVTALANNIPGYLESLEAFANRFLERFGVSADINQSITDFLTQFSQFLLTYIKNSMPKILGTAMDITSGIFNMFIGFIIGIYMLATKETLRKNIKRAVYAFIPKRGADYVTHVYYITAKRFNGFVSGQLMEAFILGALCFIGMKIFDMEYALLISIIIGITNIVPIIGPVLGAVPGVLIMLMIEPMKAVWFVIFIIILQQVESNLIYPRVVGTSVGLPGLWVMFAVLVGGSLFGLTGIILGVPILSVIYSLFAEIVGARLKSKKIKV